MSIKIENVDIHGWEAAIRGARNPMNSWEKSDSWFIDDWSSEMEEFHCHSLGIDSELLPTSYNQRRTIDLNYEVLAKQYRQRKNHKLDCWREYCEWIKTLPYSELITLEDSDR